MTDVPVSPATRRSYWDTRYETIGSTEVSWYEVAPTISIEALDAVDATPATSVIDVGGGAARLVDELLARGYDDLTVLDVSETALADARKRVGDRTEVTWIQADLLSWEPHRQWSIWHDRAVFHFLTDPADRATYRDLVHRAVEPDGAIIVATFALDGPEQCSGLPVQRYDPEMLATELGADLTVVATGHADHVTPAGGTQRFSWVALRR